MDVIEVPKPEMDVPAKINFAIEVAFGELLKEAKRLGLNPLPVMGLMYLPDEAVTRQWQDAGRAVLAILGVKDGVTAGGGGN